MTYSNIIDRQATHPPIILRPVYLTLTAGDGASPGEIAPSTDKRHIPQYFLRPVYLTLTAGDGASPGEIAPIRVICYSRREIRSSQGDTTPNRVICNSRREVHMSAYAHAYQLFLTPMWEIHGSDVGDLGSMWEIFYVAFLANLLRIFSILNTLKKIIKCIEYTMLTLRKANISTFCLILIMITLISKI